MEIRKITANILSKENAFLTRVIYTPNPPKPPSHSEITAPTTAQEAEIRNPEKNWSIAPGNLMQRKICPDPAPIDRNRLTASESTDLKPVRSPIVIGKKVVITIKITFGAISYPNQRTKSGAMATVGTVCVNTING